MLLISFSQTINKFTYLDAYPLPNLNETVNTIAQYRVYSVIDLKSAYHQVPLQNRDKKFTAFEANGRLYQLTAEFLLELLTGYQRFNAPLIAL